MCYFLVKLSQLEVHDVHLSFTVDVNFDHLAYVLLDKITVFLCSKHCFTLRGLPNRCGADSALSPVREAIFSPGSTKSLCPGGLQESCLLSVASLCRIYFQLRLHEGQTPLSFERGPTTKN